MAKRQSEAEKLFERALKKKKPVPSESLATGPAPSQPSFQPIQGGETAARFRKLAETRRNMAGQVKSARMRQEHLAAAERLERQAQSAEREAAAQPQGLAGLQYPMGAPRPNAPTQGAPAPGQPPQGLAGLRFPLGAPPQQPPGAAPTSPPAMPPEKPTRIMPLERRGVPNPQSLTSEEYEYYYGTARDVSPELPSETGQIIEGPRALNHEARLRKNGRPSGHWAMYAYLVNVDGKPTLGVQFNSGFRCFYPGTGETDYRAITNAESGSYYAHDHLRGKPYAQF